jgi:SAM-dependent methyltransferase
MYRKRFRLFRRLTGLASGLVLEVGCGNGHFLGMLAAAGYDVEGLDISETDVTYARDHLGLRVFCGGLDDLSFPSGRYDAVILFYVLEHVPAPADIVGQVFRILKPGGCITLAVPVLDSLQAKLLGSTWVQVTEAPRHLMIPSCLGVRQLLTAAGFSKVKSAPMPLQENAGSIVLSLLPAASTTRSYRQTRSGSLMVRRAAGAMLLLPALFVALAERLPRTPDRRSGLMLFCARK